VRELLSNCSDALEKQRFRHLKGESKTAEDLRIELSTNDKERTFTLFDTGVGMTKKEVVENLGTIAKSGSKEFMDKIDQSNEEEDVGSIIGQFGVGFYSSFIVADKVEVYTKSESSDKAVAWVSDGSGEFTVSDVDDLGFERGTKIVVKLRPDCREFS
jgi:TNF receptor-associated protein 1